MEDFKKEHLELIVTALSNLQFKEVGNPQVQKNIALVGQTINIAAGKLNAMQPTPEPVEAEEE